MENKKKLFVVISLDVEEEGLFSGHYPARNPEVDNVRLLPKLAPLTSEYGFAPTLFCSHAVFSSPHATATLSLMRDKYKAEIGAHLHHWSTPPYADHIDENCIPERTHHMPEDQLEKKLDNLLHAGQAFQGEPLSSFRMGRWDLKSRLLPLLASRGIKVDSSICPLRSFVGGADHFLAPADPWWVEVDHKKLILEAPITQIPVMKNAARIWHKFACSRPTLLDKFHFFGALSANPYWHGLKAMKLAAMLHVARGGQVLSIFWHSSEMMPGGSPHTPDQQSADKKLADIFAFCAWLKNNFDAKGLTATELCAITPPHPFACRPITPNRDW